MAAPGSRRLQALSRRLAPALMALALAAVGGCGQARPTGAPGPARPTTGAAGPARPTQRAPVRAAGAPGAPPDAGATFSGRAAGTVAPGMVLHGPRRRRWIALTFDADMTRAMLARLRSGRVRGWYDRRLFALLRGTSTPATIFLTGLWTQEYSGVVRRLARDNRFELANHTLDHAAFASPCFGLPAVARADRRGEVIQARRIIRRVAGVTPHYFRFPGGCATAADVRLVRAAGEVPVLWDVVSGDAFQPDPGVIVRAVLRAVRPGSIIIAHCIGAPNTPATAAAMAQLIPRLRARGYRFVTLGRLLARP